MKNNQERSTESHTHAAESSSGAGSKKSSRLEAALTITFFMAAGNCIIDTSIQQRLRRGASDLIKQASS